MATGYSEWASGTFPDDRNPVLLCDGDDALREVILTFGAHGWRNFRICRRTAARRIARCVGFTTTGRGLWNRSDQQPATTSPGANAFALLLDVRIAFVLLITRP